MKRIFVTGDTHGMIDFSKLVIFAKQNKLDRSDYIIICGDCGVLWDQESVVDYINAYDSIGATILFVDGNHENHNMLSHTLNIEWWHGGKVHKISNNIYHLQRGEIFFLYGKSFLALGGADSHDKEFRKENESWWSKETITNEDINNALSHLSNNDNYVDYVISHCPPNKILQDIENEFTQCGEEVPYYIAPKLVPENSNVKLDIVADKINFRKWFFGHLHTRIQIDNYCGLYEDIIEITDDHNVILSSDKATLERVKEQMINELEKMLDDNISASSTQTKTGKINKNSSFSKNIKGVENLCQKKRVESD